MATIDEAIITHLESQAGLTALVSQRIRFDQLDQGETLPAVVVKKISDRKLHTLTGQLDLAQPMYQFTALALTKSAAKSVAAQLKLALSDYAGTLSGIAVQYIQLQNELSSVEKTADGTTKVYFEDLEFEVNYINA